MPTDEKKYAVIAEGYRQVAADLIRADNGEISIKEALVKNGIAEKQASKGWALVRARKALNEAFQAAKHIQNMEFIDAPKLTLEQESRLMDARLAKNIIEGEDKAVQSVKLLGSRKDHNRWTADSVAGMIVIEAPKSIPRLSVDVQDNVIDVP